MIRDGAVNLPMSSPFFSGIAFQKTTSNTDTRLVIEKNGWTNEAPTSTMKAIMNPKIPMAF